MRHLSYLSLALIIAAGLSISEVEADIQEQSDATELAPGYGLLQFKAPIPGSYQLPELGSASDGKILTSENNATTLHELFANKIILLSFIYSTCSDVNGCPLATLVLHKIKGRLSKEPELQSKLRLITLSFNPNHDTPERMKAYGTELQGSGIDWQFLTTHSEPDLEPILKGYPQKIQKVYDAQGRFTDTYSHDLRVYLIDAQQQIRNIYSVSFLHPDTLISDIKTLVMAQNPTQPMPTAAASVSPLLAQGALYRAGDDKQDYESAAYQTHSVALIERKGQALDLLSIAQRPPLGLPALPIPQDNPLSAEKIALGRKLFFDRRLSLNNTFSCAMCHIPEQGFSSNEMATSVGIEGRSVRRNAPTLYNIAYAEKLFHDGRESTLEQQVWGPLLAFNEMANPAVGQVIAKINGLADYQNLFENAFNRSATMETVGMALASYERTLISGDSAFDRWNYGKQEHALNAAAQRGFALFTGKAQCNQCHKIQNDHALFMDNQLHDTGIGYRQSMTKPPESRKVQVAPGVYMDVKQEVLNAVGERKTNDLGQYEITQNPADRWKYKTPSLRNISLTAPYMHDGSLATLAEVLKFYNQGGIAHDNLDPLIKPLGLTNQELADLQAFLQSLTGSNVAGLVSDAFAAPVGDMTQ